MDSDVPADGVSSIEDGDQSPTLDRDVSNSDGTAESVRLEAEIDIFANLPQSSSLEGLIDFGRNLCTARCRETDPSWFVVNSFGSRPGNGSKDLLAGSPVDPKSNPAHRHAIQYLADVGLLKMLSLAPIGDGRSATDPLLVTTVSFMDGSVPELNKGVLTFARVRRIALIAIEGRTALKISGQEFSLEQAGEVVSFTLPDKQDLKILSGSVILVALGHLYVYSTSRNRLAHSGITATIELQSTEYEGIKTSNRRGKAPGVHEPLVPCPDCRRPIEVRKVDKDRAITETSSDTEVLVTVVCDEQDLLNAISTAQDIKDRYSDRVVLVTDERLVTDELKALWPKQRVVKALTRWTKKRGMQDYAVPEGFVTPILFPKTLEYSIKDTMYTTVRAIGIEDLWGRRVWLIDPDAQHGVEVVPSKTMYSQMLAELRDWNHPSHQARESAINFIHDWVQVYN